MTRGSEATPWDAGCLELLKKTPKNNKIFPKRLFSKAKNKPITLSKTKYNVMLNNVFLEFILRSSEANTGTYWKPSY